MESKFLLKSSFRTIVVVFSERQQLRRSAVDDVFINIYAVDEACLIGMDEK